MKKKLITIIILLTSTICLAYDGDKKPLALTETTTVADADVFIIQKSAETTVKFVTAANLFATKIGTLTNLKWCTSDGTKISCTTDAPLVGADIGVSAQAWDADLDTWATLAPSLNAQSLVTAANYAAMRTLLDLEPGVDYQVYDADLDIWATLTPSVNAQSLVTAINYAAMRTLLNLVPGTDVQAYDADLAIWATVTPSANGQSLVGAANYGDMRTLLGLVIGTNVQAYDADLTTFAGITPSANIQTLLGSANYAEARTNLGLAIGTNVQAYDADLTTYAGITPSANAQTLLSQTFAQMLTSVGAQPLDSDLTTYSTITPSANAQSLLTQTYAQMLSSIGAQAADADLTTYAGITPSANVQTLLGSVDYAAFKTSLSLGNVTNTSDADKPVSTAQQTALDLKADLDSPVFTTAIKLPMGTGPTVSAAGNIAIDTTDDQLQYYGGAKRVIPYHQTKCGYFPDLVATDDNISLGMFDAAVTITGVACSFNGTGTTAATVTLENGSGTGMTITGTNPTCVANSSNSTFAAVTANNQLEIGQVIRFDVTNTPDPVTDDYTICVRYTNDAQ